MDRVYSYNWIKEYVDTKKSAEEFAAEFSLKSQTIDRVHPYTPKFKGIITAKITKIEPHPNADKLRLATVDTGSGEQTVVCGAPNIEVGQIVPLAREGAQVLTRKDDVQQEVTIRKTKIRDVESNGMLCAYDELGLGKEGPGIWILPTDTKLGVPLESLLTQNDSLFEIEITSNRTDCMSLVGIAHEAAAVLPATFKPKAVPESFPADGERPMRVVVEEPKLCQRYEAVVMTNVEVKPSPLWMQERLLAANIRPINNLVDITNYVLLELGQPMHVFDYQKISGCQLNVRKAKKGEKLLALDGVEYELQPEHLVIADNSLPVAIAGVMGGQESGVTSKTTSIVFECANFDSLSVRKTARALNLHSESSSLFEKRLHPMATQMALFRAIELVQELAGGHVASNVIDVKNFTYEPNRIRFDAHRIPRFLGIEISRDQVVDILQRLGFTTDGDGTLLDVTVPWWRHNDIEIEEDIIEEVARIYGYHNIPTIVPEGTIPVVMKDRVLEWEDLAKDALVAMGYTEVQSYSMVSEKLLSNISIAANDVIKLANPLSEEFVYMRPTLTASVLQIIANNQHAFPSQQVFELANVYISEQKRQLPNEFPMLTLAAMGKTPEVVYDVKGAVATLLQQLGVLHVTFEPITKTDANVWDAAHSLEVKHGSVVLGTIGLLSPEVAKAFDLDRAVALADLNFATLVQHAQHISAFTPIPEFQSVDRDIALVVGDEVRWREIQAALTDVDQLVVGLEYVSTYRGEGIAEGKKSIALRVTLRSAEATLTAGQIDAVIKKITEKLAQKLHASLR